VEHLQKAVGLFYLKGYSDMAILNRSMLVFGSGLQLAIIWSVAVPLFLSQAAKADEKQASLTVGQSGAQFSTIQAAIDAATAGQSIEVRGGTYRENVKINKQVVLRGIDAGGGKPVVDGGGRDSAITLSADQITVEGFRVTGSGRKFGDAGILVTSKNNTIRNNTALKNHTGIMLQRSANNTLIENESAENQNDGICLIGATKNTLTANTTNANKHAGIWLDSYKSRGPIEPADHNTIEGNTANNNDVFGIALNTGADDNIIKTNRTSGNRDAGIMLNCGPMRNTVAENQVSNNPKAGILLFTAGLQNRIEANQVRENGSGIEVLSSSGNTFTSNQVEGNRSFGIRVDTMTPMHFISTMCVFSLNNLINNKTNAFDASGKPWQPPANMPNMPKMAPETVKALSAPNQWDNGSKGNHYSDFTKPSEGCVDANQDGISDNQHPIPGGAAVDRFPLVSPVSPIGEKK
jgi:parallel beta-helix repeat protein